MKKSGSTAGITVRITVWARLAPSARADSVHAGRMLSTPATTDRAIGAMAARNRSHTFEASSMPNQMIRMLK